MKSNYKEVFIFTLLIAFSSITVSQKLSGKELHESWFTHITTTTSGLYIMSPQVKAKVLDGAFYGVTLHNENIYVFENIKGQTGRILKIRPPFEAVCVIKDLSPGCHQIDALDNKLYITDTYNNRILVYSLDNFDLKNVYYPFGELKNGRNSDNYAHINSIYHKDGMFYIMAHNETHKTGKTSVIYICDNNFKILKSIETHANSAHNIVIKGNDLWYCDSLNYTVVKNNKVVLQYENLSRGLSITDNIIAIGESTYGSRNTRGTLPGWVNFYDHDLNFISRHETEGLVSEIRAIKSKDYSLSATQN